MPSGYTQRRVLVFVRAPELGRVKTRLEKKMDTATVLGLYRCFVEDIIQTLTSGGYDITVYFAPSHKESIVQAWLGSSFHIQAQTGRGLGQKMCNAFSNVFATEVGQAVLIGSDFPDLAIDIIHEAFVSLQNKDVTIGPVEDGGYYLMGFRKDSFDGNVFAGIDWGTEHVYQQTLQHIHDAGLNGHVLPSWQDIDTFEDLRAFYHRSKANGLMHLKTMQFLSRLKMKGFQ
jgi:rSAM/selenodomain-associated transferase 1